MTIQAFGLSIQIFLVSCLGTVEAFGQPFPKQPAAYISTGYVSDIAYSPDGKLLAVAGAAGIWLYDTENLTAAKILWPADVPRFFRSWVTTIAFSPDGRFLASGGTITYSTNRLWDVETGQQIGTWDGSYLPTAITFSPDGKLVAYTAWFSSVWLWDVTSQQQVGVINTITSSGSLAFSPDGTTIATSEIVGVVPVAPPLVAVDWEEAQRRIRFWDVSTQRQVGQIDRTVAV